MSLTNTDPVKVEAAVRRGEGRLGKGGAFLCSTGQFTGRSPKDKFVVRTPAVENSIWWENNAPMAPEAFDLLHADMLEHMKGKDYFVQDLFGGADPAAVAAVNASPEPRLVTVADGVEMAKATARMTLMLITGSPAAILAKALRSMAISSVSCVAYTSAE